MTITLRPGQSIGEVVTAGNRSCPACTGAVRRWGHARWRVVRDHGGEWGFAPDRVRCRDCGATHVVLPAMVLLRRRDASAVVGRAWRWGAAGAGSRRVARLLGVPMETVRGWLRRLRTWALSSAGPGPGGTVGALQRALADAVDDAGRAGWRTEHDLWDFRGVPLARAAVVQHQLTLAAGLRPRWGPSMSWIEGDRTETPLRCRPREDISCLHRNGLPRCGSVAWAR